MQPASPRARALHCPVSQQKHSCDHHEVHQTDANLCPLEVLLDPGIESAHGCRRGQRCGTSTSDWPGHSQSPSAKQHTEPEGDQQSGLQTPSSSSRTCHLLVSRERKPLLTFGTSMCKASNSPAAFEIYHHWTASHPGNLFTGPTKPENNKTDIFLVKQCN